MSVNAVDWALRFAARGRQAQRCRSRADVSGERGRRRGTQRASDAQEAGRVVQVQREHGQTPPVMAGSERADPSRRPAPAGHFSEWHRPVVWDLCLGNRLDLDPDFFDSNDIDSTRGGRPSTENRAKGNPGSHVDRGYGDGDTGKPQLTGEPRFTAVTPPPAHLVSYSTSLVRNNSALRGISRKRGGRRRKE